MERAGTELIVIVTDKDGVSKTFDGQASDPADRPRGISHGSQLGSGFYTGAFTLTRKIDRDNDDLHLGDDVKFIGANNDTAYEGFITAMPRSMDNAGHALNVTLAGWMAHSADEPFSVLFIDRDLGRWQDASMARKVTLEAVYDHGATSITTSPDASGARGVMLTVNAVPFTYPGGEYWYDAGPANLIAEVRVTSTMIGFGLPDAALSNSVFVASTDTTPVEILDLTGSNTVPVTFRPTALGRYAGVGMAWLNTAGGTAGTTYGARWQNIAVIGDHGLMVTDGVTASDVIRYVAGRYCPLLNTAGVQDTTYPIEQLVCEDVKPYDAFLKVNSFHLWDLAVWEDRTLWFQAIDLTEWDWEIRHDEVGSQIGLQGDTITELRNGIIVSFTNVSTGRVERLHPDDYAELRDESIDNPFNQHGRRGYSPPYQIPFPCTPANALELGRLRLLEDNQVKAPGSFTIQGHCKDRAGILQPVWQIRSGDRIRLTSSANLSDRPRLIHEVQHSQDGLSATVSVDSTLLLLEAFVDRQTTALQAAGLI